VGGDNQDDGPKAREVEEALRAKVDTLVPELLPARSATARSGRAARSTARSGNADEGQPHRAAARAVDRFQRGRGHRRYSGDMLQLIASSTSADGRGATKRKSKAIAWAKSFLGWDKPRPRQARQGAARQRARDAAPLEAARIEAAGKRKSAWAMWCGAVPIAGTPAEAYLRGRGIDFDRLGRIPGSLRFLPDCWCSTCAVEASGDDRARSIAAASSPARTAPISTSAAARRAGERGQDRARPATKKFRIATAADKRRGCASNRTS
jgi:hypothetical protein